MSDIYAQHDAAFKAVSAYLVLRDGKPVAKVAFKFGTAVTAYVHWFGIEMAKGRAVGGGYDRQSAAVADAARKIPDDITGRAGDGDIRAAFTDNASKDDGKTWVRSLEDTGFSVVQAV